MALTLRGIHRLGLWVILIILTVTLLLFPTHLTLEYYGIQSSRIFTNLPLFAVLFCIWLLILLILLFSQRGEVEGDWEKLALVCVFSAVFLGFWTILTHDVGRGEGLNNAAHVKYLNEVAKIPVGFGVFGYFDFPGLHVIGSFVSQSIGLNPINSAAMILFFQALLLASLLYVLFRRLLNSLYAASLAVLLVIAGNIWISKLNIFHPRNMGLILLLTFLVLMFRQKETLFRMLPDTFLILIVAATTTMTHFVTSILLFFITLGIYVVKKLDRTNTENTPPLIIFLVFPLAWALYWSTLTFGFTIESVALTLQQWIGGKDILWTISMMLRANVGGSMPLWSDITRLFWWVLIYGFGSIVGLCNLFRLKKLTPIQKRATGVLLGIIAVSAISTVASLGGERFDTYILYGAFAAIPIILWFLMSLRNPIKKYAFVGLVIIFFILSFPSFLAHNNTIEMSAYYPDEHALGKFLEYYLDEAHIYFTEPETPFMTLYYTPNAYFYRLHPLPVMKDEDDLWAEVERLGNSFDSWADEQMTAVVFPLTKRSTSYYQHFFEVTPENYKWSELVGRLSIHNKIYDSGNIKMFSVHFLSNSSESIIPVSVK